jgi:hypothetical protein
METQFYLKKKKRSCYHKNNDGYLSREGISDNFPFLECLYYNYSLNCMYKLYALFYATYV